MRIDARIRSGFRAGSVFLSLFLAADPIASARGEDQFAAEERQRIRQLRNEEQRNKQRAEEKSRERISAERKEGESNLAKLDDRIREARTALDTAKRLAGEWAASRGRDVPADILARAKRIHNRLANTEQNRRTCESQLHSPNYVVSGTVRRIAELEDNARAATREANDLCRSVRNLYVEEGQEVLRNIAAELETASSSLSRVKDDLRKTTFQDLEKSRENLLKRRKEAEAAKERAKKGDRRSSGREETEYNRNLRFAEQELSEILTSENWNAMRIKDLVESKTQALEFRLANLSSRRERCGREIIAGRNDSGTWARNSPDWDAAVRTTLVELESVAALKSETASFCDDVSTFEKHVAILFGSGGTRTAKKPAAAGDDAGKTEEKRKTGSGYIRFWSPWDDSAELSSTRR